MKILPFWGDLGGDAQPGGDYGFDAAPIRQTAVAPRFLGPPVSNVPTIPPYGDPTKNPDAGTQVITPARTPVLDNPPVSGGAVPPPTNAPTVMAPAAAGDGLIFGFSPLVVIGAAAGIGYLLMSGKK